MSMGVPPLLQFSIALFTGMVAATFLPPIRRAIPRPVEAALWLGLITVCVLGVTGVSDKNARDVSAAAVWGAEQLVNTVFGLLFTGATSWIYEQRFAILGWLTIAAAADVLALILLRLVRSAKPRTPRVHLREWVELPPPARSAVLAHKPVHVPRVGAGRRFAGATSVAATGVLAVALAASAGLPDAIGTHAGRVRARSRAGSLRDAAAHLRFAAQAWYQCAARPAMNAAGTWTHGQVIDIRGLLSAHALGGHAPTVQPDETTEGIDDDAQSPDKLAS